MPRELMAVKSRRAGGGGHRPNWPDGAGHKRLSRAGGASSLRAGRMSFTREKEDDYAPITWIGQVPIYVTTMLVILHGLAMIATAVAMAVSGAPAAVQSALLQPFIFSNAAVLQDFQVWQVVTYAFVNEPSLWFAVEMWMLYMFGREVEKFLGRRAFLWLYLALVLAAPIALTALGVAKVPAFLVGSSAVHFAIFIAFVILYPGAEFFFGLQAKWVGIIFLAVYSLQYLAHQAWIPLGVLWLDCACAAMMLRFSGVTNAAFETWLPARPEPRPRPTAKPAARAVESAPEPADVHESIDPLLEKISRSGIGSLTKQERQQLEKARAALLERERHPH